MCAMTIYNASKLVEAITTESFVIASEGRRPSLRSIALRSGLSVRNAYKLLERARRMGFSFSVSTHIGLIGYSFLLSESIERGYISLESYETIDGRLLVLAMAPTKTERRPHTSQSFPLLITSRPSVEAFMLLRFHTERRTPEEEVVDALRNIVRNLMNESLPGFKGRSYPLGEQVTLLIASLISGGALSFSPKLSRELGIEPAKARRLLRALWRRRVLLGYGVWRAPYTRGKGVIVRVEHDNPYELAYALSVLPPVLRILASTGALVAIIDAEEEVASVVIKALKSLGASVSVEHCYYKVSHESRY